MVKRSRKIRQDIPLIRMKAILTVPTCKYWKFPLLEMHRLGCAPVSVNWNTNERRRTRKKGAGLKRMVVMAVGQRMAMVDILSWSRGVDMMASIRSGESIPAVSDRLLYLRNQNALTSGLMVIETPSRHLESKVNCTRASRN